MNRNVIISDDQPWAVDRSAPHQASSWQADPVGDAKVDFASLVRIITLWRWLILGAAGVGLLGAVVLTLLTRPMYRSWVTLEVNTPTVEIMDEQSHGGGPFRASDQDGVATEIGLLSSRSIAERVAQQMNLANNVDFGGSEGDAASRLKRAADKVATGLKVDAPSSEAQLIRFSFDSASPRLSAAIANQIADSFIDSTLQRRYEASAYARSFLEKQISKTRSDLEKSEKSLVEYAQSEGIIATSSTPGEQVGSDTNSLQGESLVALNRALADATARRVSAEGAYRQGTAVGITSEVNASTQALRQTRANLEAEYQEKRNILKPDHPDMLSLRSRIDELDRQIANETRQVSSGRANSLLADYRAALAAENALQGQVATLKGQVLNLRGRSIRYTILQREVDTNRSLYDALLQRYKEVGVAGGIGASPVSIVDRADVPDRPYKPNLLFNVAAGLGLGLLAGLARAIAMESLNDTVKSREEVRSKLKLACLGAIPKSPGRDTFVEELKDPKSSVSEAYSAVAASLRFSTDEGLPRRLLVTSTRSGEGKSSTSLALAQNFSRRGAKVLLIDCDLRKPAFKTNSEKVGLTRLLTSEGERTRSHIARTQFEKLFLLPAGPIPPNPADLLSTSRFSTILDELQPDFDMIICDAPPLLGLADSVLMAPVVGAVLMVVESGKTRTKAALECLRQLGGANAHIVGAALNKSTEDVSGYGYGGYGYGSLDRRKVEIPLITNGVD